VKPAIDILEERISAAMATTTGQSDCAAIVRPSTDPKFGDYQANGVMALAKKIKTNPRKLAEEVVGNLDVSDICEEPEVAGPGFINLRLKANFIANNLFEINADSANRLSIDKESGPKTIVIDFSLATMSSVRTTSATGAHSLEGSYLVCGIFAWLISTEIHTTILVNLKNSRLVRQIKRD
jgi:hypothetical protein